MSKETNDEQSDEFLEQLKREGWTVTHNESTVTISADLMNSPDGIGVVPRKP